MSKEGLPELPLMLVRFALPDGAVAVSAEARGVSRRELPGVLWRHPELLHHARGDEVAQILEGARLLGLDLDLERGTLGKSGARDKPCFASVSRHEISYCGRKVVGSAQRIGEGAMLQHGSIPADRSYLRIVDYMRFSGAGGAGRARERLGHVPLW